jgi:hypothetical protein
MFKSYQEEFTCLYCRRTLPVTKAVIFDYFKTIYACGNGDIHCVDCWLEKDKEHKASE